ncbi:peptide/nickel transport system ATP-binding protein [Sedimentibacter acidaminivorans]|uniref:Peptide/nickel transport system ATP-binding protein n=1 Tax=Sedimentibacter acidaminivorans TaxID=913099 RepID=A0ABS4GEZ7_9FIRM|nr:ATP-binding cassette domain-containing protein [Sedimentibacter acidaminivorans]MBP1926266.1 peptide/nickel transport system ATP-binding protein [Sedimentibacter acidaminivorans]
MLEIKDYIITFDNNKIIKYDDIKIYEHEFIGFSGNSGCGKSSLLDSLFGINFKGQVSYSKANLLNKDLLSLGKEKYKYISYSPQFSQDALNPKINVNEHIQLTLKGNGLNYDEKKVFNIFNDLLLDIELLNYYPYMLSGGQKQRIAIMLSVIKNPRLLIFDEPSSAIDLITLKTIVNFMIKIKDHTTIIMVSHNYDFLVKLCDRVIKI